MSIMSIPVDAICAGGNPNYQQFAFFVTPDVIRQALGHDPRDSKRRQLRSERPELADIYESVQRKTTKKRREGLVPYIANRMLVEVKGPALGVLPALMVGFTSAPLFSPSKPQESDGPGVLRLSLSEDEQRVLLDGLGRLDAVMALREGYEIEGQAYRIEDSSRLPLLLHVIAPHTGRRWNYEHLQQIFHDINCLSEPVRPAIAMRGEHANVFVQLTRQLASCDAIETYGGMTVGSPSAKGDNIVSQQQVLKFVRAALGGPRAAESDSFRVPEQDRIERDLSETTEGLCAYLGAISEAMGEDKWPERDDSFHLTTAGLATLGLAFWYTTRLNDELQRGGKRVIDVLDVADLIGSRIDWSRANDEWGKLGVTKTNKDGDVVIAGAGRSTRAAMFSTVARAMLAKWPHTADAARAVQPALFSEHEAEVAGG